MSHTVASSTKVKVSGNAGVRVSALAFRHTATGATTLGGCSGFSVAYYSYYAYGIGSIVYSKPAALKGKYEKVVVKDVRLPKNYDLSPFKSMGRRDSLSPLYIDTLNAYWNEEELVSYSDAVALVREYSDAYNAGIEQLALKCK